jgi:cobyrinic acid a,c-diamide synthase
VTDSPEPLARPDGSFALVKTVQVTSDQLRHDGLIHALTELHGQKRVDDRGRRAIGPAMTLGPRVVVAGTHSGVGKTTVATGLMAALRRRGLTVASAKVGPDFIDPGYHHLATDRVGRNLDSFLCGKDAILPIAAKAAFGADILVVEGVMGLFDGLGASLTSSTAEIAALLDAPVVLVVDASSMSSSVRALVDGYDYHLRHTCGRPVEGVVLNRVGSDTHESLLREALWRARRRSWVCSGATGRSSGGTATSASSRWPRTRSGVTASLDRLAARGGGLPRPDRPGGAGPPRPAACAPLPCRPPDGCPVRRCGWPLITGKAFGFSYPDNLERLAEAGAELLPVDPLADAALPEGAQALYACGGFPEVFAAELGANAPLLADARMKIDAGLPTWAECGGLLWLSRSRSTGTACVAWSRPRPRSAAGSPSATGPRRSRLSSPIGPAGARCSAATSTTTRRSNRAVSRSSCRDGPARVSRAGRRPRSSRTYLHLHLGGDRHTGRALRRMRRRRLKRRAPVGRVPGPHPQVHVTGPHRRGRSPLDLLDPPARRRRGVLEHADPPLEDVDPVGPSQRLTDVLLDQEDPGPRACRRPRRTASSSRLHQDGRETEGQLVGQAAPGGGWPGPGPG